MLLPDAMAVTSGWRVELDAFKRNASATDWLRRANGLFSTFGGEYSNIETERRGSSVNPD